MSITTLNITLKTDLCDKLIMLDQPLGRDTSHDRAKIESINVDQGIIKNPHAQLINLD